MTSLLCVVSISGLKREGALDIAASLIYTVN